MQKDPWTEWDGPHPYDVLAPAGIHPDSSMHDVQEAPFALIEAGKWNAEARLAWDQVRTVARRLWVDFWMYPMEEEQISTQLVRLVETGRSVEISLEPVPEFAAPDTLAEDMKFEP